MWPPISVLLLPHGGYLSTGVLKRAVASGSEVAIVCAGDAMWPSVRHGQTVAGRLADPRSLAVGQAVIVAAPGSPDLQRVVDTAGDRLLLAADADPRRPSRVSRGEIVATVELPRRRPSAGERRARRAWLEIREALFQEPERASDPAATVLDKYDEQAPYYDRRGGESLGAGLSELIASHVAREARVLVAGCGTGWECRALAAEGFDVVGVDYSPRMIEIAREACAADSRRIELLQADLRSMPAPAAGVGAVLFTPDVYSLLPFAADRIAILERMAEWLPGDGRVIVSARPAGNLYERALLTLHWLSRRRVRRTGWGSTHTRWIDTKGRLRRSFVRRFSRRALVREWRRGGWVESEARAGWSVLTRA